MATITERLSALESLLSDSATLKDRIAALEEKIKSLTQNMENGEKQYEYLKALSDGRMRTIDETTTKIKDELDQFTNGMTQLCGPFDEKVSDLTKRLKEMETQIGISN